MPGPSERLGDLVHVHVRVATAPDELNFSFHCHGGQDRIRIVELSELLGDGRKVWDILGPR